MAISKTTYCPINTDWFYSYVDIPNLDVIQHELINLLKSPAPQRRFTNYYINIYVPYIVNCPELMGYLKKTGLRLRLQRILYSVSNGPDLNHAPPHVDSVTPSTAIRYSLNIPLIDAIDSYTVWYEKTDDSTILYDTVAGTGWVRENTPVREIARAQYTQPILLNTSILHGGNVSSPKRVIAGLRFFPELTLDEIQWLGVPVPLMQQ